MQFWFSTILRRTQDESGFLKQGKASCGVHQQYTGSAGKITNCQIGVFTAYASRLGHAFIDRALHRPETRTSDPARLAAHVPEGTTFPTKPSLALAMIERAIAARVPSSEAAADLEYGVGDIEMALRRAGKGYVLGVKTDHRFNAWVRKPPVAGTAETIANGLVPSAWARPSADDGMKGARLYDGASCELADLEGADDDQTGLWTRGLLFRRSLNDGERVYVTTWCPPAHRSRLLGRSRASVGRSRTRSRRPRPNSGLLTTKPVLARLAPARQPGHDGLRLAGDDPP